ncbi:MAG: hypothetical protein J5I65_03720 [Aridibacter famidurans]|nr:hypothetical protein [Aridibacter famidurans]
MGRRGYGFGKVLLDIHSFREKNKLPANHEFNHIMTRPVLVRMKAIVSDSKLVSSEAFNTAPWLPSDYMMDNNLFYGEYEIIRNEPLVKEDFDFPMSYGGQIRSRDKDSYLQWGLIQRNERSRRFSRKFMKLVDAARSEYTQVDYRPEFEYRSIGFQPCYGRSMIRNTVANAGRIEFGSAKHYKSVFDLRNPRNAEIRVELMKAFGLRPDLGYFENCEMTKTPSILDFIGQS